MRAAILLLAQSAFALATPAAAADGLQLSLVSKSEVVDYAQLPLLSVRFENHGPIEAVVVQAPADGELRPGRTPFYTLEVIGPDGIAVSWDLVPPGGQIEIDERDLAEVARDKPAEWKLPRIDHCLCFGGEGVYRLRLHYLPGRGIAQVRENADRPHVRAEFKKAAHLELSLEAMAGGDLVSEPITVRVRGPSRELVSWLSRARTLRLGQAADEAARLLGTGAASDKSDPSRAEFRFGGFSVRIEIDPKTRRINAVALHPGDASL